MNILRHLGMASAICLFTLSPSQQYLDQNWMHGNWKGYDSAFKAARASIDAISSDSRKLDAVIKEARKKCDSPNAKSIDLFRWATAFRMRCRDFDFSNTEGNSHLAKKPYDLFPKLSVSTSYEFTRLRALFTIGLDFPHHSMVPLVEKLRSRESQDWPVNFALLRIYQPNIRPDERAKGLKIVALADSVLGDNSLTLASTGYFYYVCWKGSKSKSDAREAVRRGRALMAISKSESQKKIIISINSVILKKHPELR